MLKIFRYILAILLGVLLTSLFFFVSGINDNGRYIPIATNLGDATFCVLDTRTGVIYCKGINKNGKFSGFDFNITDTSK